MPCFRGIEISIVGRADVQRFPEFPHPDASSVRLDASFSGASDSQKNSLEPTLFPSVESLESDNLHTRKTEPSISVYIPSQPGMSAKFIVVTALLEFLKISDMLSSVIRRPILG